VNFIVVYCTSKKKFKKYIKVNSIKRVVVLDVNEIKETMDINSADKLYLKVLIFQKIQIAIERGKDIYYIPDFNEDFSIEKLLNIKSLINNYNFNILLFHKDFESKQELLNGAMGNLGEFDYSQIIRDY
jgi:hypothetical protein